MCFLSYKQLNVARANQTAVKAKLNYNIIIKQWLPLWHSTGILHSSLMRSSEQTCQVVDEETEAWRRHMAC